MKVFDNLIGRMVALIGILINYFWGGWDVALKTLLIFMAIDYITGILCGYYNRQLSSVRAFEGIVKKIFILTMITIATQLDLITKAEGYMRSLVLFYYIGVESISIIENASHFITIPEKLIDSLEQLQEGNKKERKDNNG